MFFRFDWSNILTGTQSLHSCLAVFILEPLTDECHSCCCKALCIKTLWDTCHIVLSLFQVHLYVINMSVHWYRHILVYKLLIFFKSRCFFMRPQWDWWLGRVLQGHTSCWITASDAGHTMPTPPVWKTQSHYKMDTRILLECSTHTHTHWPLICKFLLFFFSLLLSPPFCLPLLSSEGECILGERERAHAILLACRHLPMPLLTPPGHRARLLAEAKRTLERVGDRRSLQDCQQILLRLSGGTTIAASWRATLNKNKHTRTHITF